MAKQKAPNAGRMMASVETLNVTSHTYVEAARLTTASAMAPQMMSLYNGITINS